uniref:Reverse transcriptase domain-containing protein n=1 Tax=Tanacetum cinerariifolium TaxID=118510 RepID=A0A6L2KCP8_TANCI|nr:hypothetical protein [Tanacetum cinerariifolium]
MITTLESGLYYYYNDWDQRLIKPVARLAIFFKDRSYDEPGVHELYVHLSIGCAPFKALYRRKCRLKAARDHQKSYADNMRKPLEFEVGDQVLLKVSPWKGVVCFGKKGNLAPRYSSVHDTFYVSNLKKCLADANLHVPLEEIKVDKTLCFVEEPVEIMDCEVKKLKRCRISIVKVRWNSKRGPEFTWEQEDFMKAK